MQKPLDSNLVYRKKNTADVSAPGQYALLVEEKAKMQSTINFLLQKIVEKHSA